MAPGQLRDFLFYEEPGITLYCGDCREVLPLLDHCGVVITDPPYSSGARRDADRQVRGAMLRETDDEDWFSHDAMTSWGYSWFLRSVLTEMRPRLDPGAHVYVFSDWRQTPNVYGMLEATGYRVNQCLVWAKTHYGMGSYWRNQHENIVFASLGVPKAMLDRGMGSVLTVAGISPDAREHPTEKPVALIQRVLVAVAGEPALDPFCGSGTTLLAAKNLGRRAIGIEIEPKYCEIAVKRLRQEVLL